MKILRLYAVSTTITAVVVATDENKAAQLFHAEIRAIVSDQSTVAGNATEILSSADLPDEWDKDCMPYGRGNDLTIGELLDLTPPPVVRDTKTIDMFAEPKP